MTGEDKREKADRTKKEEEVFPEDKVRRKERGHRKRVKAKILREETISQNKKAGKMSTKSAKTIIKREQINGKKKRKNRERKRASAKYKNEGEANERKKTRAKKGKEQSAASQRHELPGAVSQCDAQRKASETLVGLFGACVCVCV
jgi:hypothetical protein